MAYDDYLSQERARMASQSNPLSPQAPQAPAYQFRDDRNAALDRQSSNFQASTAAAAKAPADPFAPATGGASNTGFAGFQNDLEAGAPTSARPSGNNPFAPVDTKAQVSGAISRLLSNPTGGFDQNAAIARQNAVKSNQTANENLRASSALSFLPGTGQDFAPAQQQTDQQLLAMRDFDATNAANRATAEQAGLQQGAGLGLQQEGQRLSAQQAAAQLAETQRQFNEHLPIEAASAKAAADTAAGNLGVSQGQLALNKQLGTGNLNISQEQLDLQKQLGLGNLSLEQQKVANQASQFATQQEFQQYALKAGMDQHTADLAWQANQQFVQQKWQTGERLSTEDYTTLINKSNQDFEAAQNQIKDTLQLTVQGNQQAFDKATAAAAQAYDAAKTDKALSHEDAVNASNQVFQKAMQEAGFSQAQIIQAQQLTAQATLAKNAADLQETMHMADLAQSDKQFGEKMGLDYAQLDANKEQFMASLNEKSSEFAQQFGLDEKQVNAALASDDFKNEMEKVQIGLQLTKDNPDAAKLFAKSLATTMGKSLGLSADEITKGAAIFEAMGGGTTAGTGPGGTPATTAEAFKSFDSLLDSKGGFASDAAKAHVQTMGKTLANTVAAYKPDATNSLPRQYNAEYQKAVERLQGLGVKTDKIVSRKDSSDGSIFTSSKQTYSSNPAFADYSIYVSLLGGGMREADAKSALTTLLGPVRAQTALGLEPGGFGPAATHLGDISNAGAGLIGVNVSGLGGQSGA